ncbi:MAG: hypothetical protein ACN4GZ_03995 [Acidimicrobiales bacterium]
MDSQKDVYTAVLAISDPGACVAARYLVQKHERYEILREVPNAVMAIDACEILKPDVLLIADDSPGLRGTEVLGEIRLHSPNTKVILIATYDASYLQDSEHAFVSATIAVPESITEALNAVAEVIEDPDSSGVPERRRTDRRLKQDWTKVFAERRADSRRDIEEVG